MELPQTGSGALPPARFYWQRLDFQLLVAVLLAAIPTLILGATEFIEYDGYCYIFGAGEDQWHNLVRWYQHDSHPPLFYFFLRAALQFGRSHLVYRAVSILAGLGTVYLVGLAASKMMRSRIAPAFAALAFGLAMPTIELSCSVRAYMLCTFFVMLSFWAFLGVLAREGGPASLRKRIFFVAAALLACLSDYYAFFYVAAVLLVSVVFDFLQRSEARSKPLARDAATFAPILGVMSYQYFSHVQEHGAQPHLADFFYQSAGPESLGEYLLRNLQNFFNLFSPWPASDLSVFLAILAALLAVAAFTLWRLLRHSEPGKRAALATMAAAGVMLIELMLAGALGKYPFGGFMRHQFLLFPFLVLCAFLFPDRLAGAIPIRARYPLAALLFVAILGVSYSRFEAYPKVKEALMTDQMRRYNSLFPEAAAVYTDHYNFIAFFLHHDDWEWKFVGRTSSEANVANIDIYRIRRGGRQILVFHDNGLWVADPLDAGVYYSMAACIRAQALPSITFFRSAQDDDPARDKAGLQAYRKQIADTARDQGLCVESLDLHGSDVFAKLRAGGCDPESPAAAGR